MANGFFLLASALDGAEMAKRIILHGPKLRAARIAARMSLEMVAHRAGISWLTVQRAETGVTKSHRSATLTALANALNVKEHDITDDTIVID